MPEAHDQHADEAAAETTQPAEKSKTTRRTTLDLSPDMHRAAKRWCAHAAVEADVDVVPMVTVMRLLLETLIQGEPKDEPLSDSELQERLHRAVIRGITRARDGN
ncbi:hypothetical protein HUF15_40615 [Streptomyces samsunensis]|uniref:hypothetical protein n=1 Tax=Streptomyces malaysiensis TaxID=92644 RepID=UPI0015815ACC|nr:hypothetical protein [Streptomyces samsunensis]NUH42924.1 hypothetical protein [Streptomyces samsunensis]